MPPVMMEELVQRTYVLNRAAPTQLGVLSHRLFMSRDRHGNLREVGQCLAVLSFGVQLMIRCPSVPVRKNQSCRAFGEKGARRKLKVDRSNKGSHPSHNTCERHNYSEPFFRRDQSGCAALRQRSRLEKVESRQEQIGSSSIAQHASDTPMLNPACDAPKPPVPAGRRVRQDGSTAASGAGRWGSVRRDADSIVEGKGRGNRTGGGSAGGSSLVNLPRFCEVVGDDPLVLRNARVGTSGRPVLMASNGSKSLRHPSSSESRMYPATPV